MSCFLLQEYILTNINTKISVYNIHKTVIYRDMITTVTVLVECFHGGPHISQQFLTISISLLWTYFFT